MDKFYDYRNRNDVNDWGKSIKERLDFEKSLSQEIITAMNCFEQAINSGSSITEARAYAIEKFLSFNLERSNDISHDELKKLDEALYRASLEMSQSKKR